MTNPDSDCIYADYNATYPVTNEHFQELCSVLCKAQGNPSSIHHAGRAAYAEVEKSREYVAQLFGAKRQNIIFCSGATEANNMVLTGVLAKFPGQKPHIIVSAGEHASVLEPAKRLAAQGACELELAPLHRDGTIDEEGLLKLLRPDTAFVGLIYASNEVGAVTMLDRLAPKIKARSPACFFHSDGVQALGKISCTWVGNTDVDSMAVSGHKIGALKGIGALYLKERDSINPFIVGGGQERGLRAGTLNVPGIVSLGLRARDCLNDPLSFEKARVVRDFFITALADIPGAVLHSPKEGGLPGTVNFHCDGVEGSRLMLHFELARIAVSSGSACSSGMAKPSAVLSAMGYDNWIAENSVRVSFGSSSTTKDAEAILQALREITKDTKR